MDQENSKAERAGGSALSEKKIAFFYGIGAVLLTLAVRIYLFENYYAINNDGVLYIEAARYFWERAWREGLASFYPPLYPLMIAAAYPLVGDWELAGQFWPFTLSILLLAPLFGLLRSMYGSKVARVALYFYAVSPYIARFSLHVRSEIPYIFFLVLALYFLQRALIRNSPRAFVLTGISAAGAYLIRSEGVGLVLVSGVFLLYRGWFQSCLRRRCLELALVLVGFVLLAAPYVFYLRWDTGSWLISRKAGLILSLGMADFDPETQVVSMRDSDRVSLVHMISSQPFTYAKKVFVDSFRSWGVYVEALHYSYLPFLIFGCIPFFRSRFWQKDEFLLMVVIVFYLEAFSVLYVNRRYAVPLASLSLGWVGLGFLAFQDYFRTRWKKRGNFFTALLVVLVLVTTLPKTLQAIGQDKVYLREAGSYLKEKLGHPTIITTVARVAFYAEGRNRILLREIGDFPAVLGTREADYLALDGETFVKFKDAIGVAGWLSDKEFSTGSREKLFIFHRGDAS